MATCDYIILGALAGYALAPIIVALGAVACYQIQQLFSPSHPFVMVWPPDREPSAPVMSKAREKELEEVMR